MEWGSDGSSGWAFGWVSQVFRVYKRVYKSKLPLALPRDWKACAVCLTAECERVSDWLSARMWSDVHANSVACGAMSTLTQSFNPRA